MSGTVELIAVGVSARALARAVDLGQRLAEEWENRFSRFREESQLSGLNTAAAAPVPVDDEFIRMLDTVRRAVRRTGGRFDPSILPALEAAGYDRDITRIRYGVAPGASAGFRPAAGHAGWERVLIDRARREIRLPVGMRIDLGGIAKGAFVDRLALALAEWPGGCIDAGGDLRVWGLPPDGHEWTIGIEDPGQPERDLLVARLPASASIGVATSGIHRRWWRAGDRIAHHLIDPRSGAPLEGDIRSATAFARDVTTAEVATKALMMGAMPESIDTFGATMAVVVSTDGVQILEERNADARPISVSLLVAERRTA
jgi:thiamine biosynthesis lipoprotein